MKTLFSLFSLLFVSHAVATPFVTGQREFVFEDAARARKLFSYVWYPADKKHKPSAVFHKGSPFVPVIAAVDAPFAGSGKFPLVLLSHGSGGKADKLFWLADWLAGNGVIVLAVDHPGNKTGDSSALGMTRVWERPLDLTFALNRLLEKPEFKSRIDVSKIAAAGHSAGGTTALLLGGAQFQASRFTTPIPFCEGTKDPYFAKVCEDTKSIDFKSFPKEVVEADYRDPRVKAFIALDPGFAKSFDPASLKALKTKALVFIAERLNAPQDEIQSKDFKTLLTAGQVEVVPGSFHMTFLQPCKPNYPKDEPELRELCVENDRKIVLQKRVAAQSLDFLNRVWKL